MCEMEKYALEIVPRQRCMITLYGMVHLDAQDLEMPMVIQEHGVKFTHSRK